MRQQVKELEVDSKRLQIDLNSKNDEVMRLKRSVAEIDELRGNYVVCEQKLDYQVKVNKTMQEKLFQLQSELAAKGFFQGQKHLQHSSPSSSITAEASYESIFENFKLIITQMSARNMSSQSEVDDLKQKVSRNESISLTQNDNINFTGLNLNKQVQDLNLKLNHEHIQNQTLEVKLRLADQEKDNLKRLLFERDSRVDDR